MIPDAVLYAVAGALGAGVEETRAAFVTACDDPDETIRPEARLVLDSTR